MTKASDLIVTALADGTADALDLSQRWMTSQSLPEKYLHVFSGL